MTEWIVTSGILILIVIALRFVFRGKVSLRLQYGLWAVVLARLLLPVSFGSSAVSAANIPDVVARQPAVQAVVEAARPMDYEEAYHQVVDQYRAQGTDVSSLPEQELAQLQQQAQALTQERSFLGTLLEILPLIWAVGAAVMGALLLWTNLRFYGSLRKHRRSLPVPGCKLPVYVADNIDTPCLFGLGKPAIYVTEAVARDETLLRHSIAHETTHCRHGDHIWSLLRGVCLAIHWYHPLVWWAAFLSRRDAELACDEGTIRRLGEAERAEYGRTLIGMTCRKHANVLSAATTMHIGKSGIKERIALIVRKPKTLIYALIAVVLIAAVAVGCTFTGAVPGEKEEPEITVKGTLIFPQGEVTGITVHYQNKQDIQVGRQDMRKMLAWAQGFTYGDPLDAEPAQDNGTLTLHYADGTSVTAGIDAAEYEGVRYQVLRGDFPACWNRLVGITVEPIIPPTLPPDVTQPTWSDTPPTQPNQPEEETLPVAETVPTGPTDAPVAEIDMPGIGTLYSWPDPDRICIMVWPTWGGGRFYYIIPENQEDFFAAYNQAAEEFSNEEREWPGDAGWSLEYKGTNLYAGRDGSLYTWSSGCIDGKPAETLFALCLQAIRDTGIEEPVLSGDLVGIRKVTLEWNGTHTVTDWATLKRIESWLVNSEEMTGASACPMSALMTVELQNGETKTIAMATDDCGVWMSQGVYYRYALDGEGNQAFYSIFGASVIHEAARSGDIDLILFLSRYLDWSLYTASYGQNEAFALMDMLKNWAVEEPDLSRIQSFIFKIHGLDGQLRERFGGYLTELYQLNPRDFAWAIMGNASPETRDYLLELLAEIWNMEKNAVSAKLKSEYAD